MTKSASPTSLTKEQEAFLEECNLEFSDRFTDSDIEYRKIYDAGVPSPPIMCPWNLRSRFNNWDRGNEGRFNDRRDHRYDNNRTRDYGDNRPRDYGERRYRPY